MKKAILAVSVLTLIGANSTPLVAMASSIHSALSENPQSYIEPTEGSINSSIPPETSAFFSIVAAILVLTVTITPIVAIILSLQFSSFIKTIKKRAEYDEDSEIYLKKVSFWHGALGLVLGFIVHFISFDGFDGKYWGDWVKGVILIHALPLALTLATIMYTLSV